MRRSRSSLIIFFTFLKGSSATLEASAERTRLRSCTACSWRYSAARCWAGPAAPARSWPRDWRFFCRSEGRCFSALPDTASLSRMSMAFWMASSSSPRSSWRDSKSVAFCSQVATRSPRYFTSASLVVVVSSRSPLASALAWSFLALTSAFSSRSVVAASIWSFRSISRSSKACWAFISSFSRAVRSSTNLSWSFSRMSMTPWDWNS
mmetsp:Transcript_88069/g.274043  ORF Transcript_88069/g.274043 Transcript_88069/m.274043 type:complete len:207 (+) Transcript_88069:84-704(+)